MFITTAVFKRCSLASHGFIAYAMRALSEPPKYVIDENFKSGANTESKEEMMNYCHFWLTRGFTTAIICKKKCKFAHTLTIVYVTGKIPNNAEAQGKPILSSRAVGLFKVTKASHLQQAYCFCQRDS